MKHKLSWLIVCLLVLLLGACKKDPISRTEPVSPIVPSEPAEPEKTPTVEEGQALVKFTVDERYNGFVLSTSAEEIIIGKALNEVRSNSNRCVQSFFVNDGDQVFLMARTPVNETTQVTLDSHSTAIALVTLHPLFAPIAADEYPKLVSKIETASKFSELCQEVSKVVEQKSNIYDPENSALIQALDDLLDELCADISDNQNSEASVAVGSSNYLLTRAVYNTPKINPTYVAADITGNELTLKTVGLTPTYYGTATHASGKQVDMVIRSRNDYGFLDLFQKTSSTFNYGDPVEFSLSQDGEYKFYFSRMTPAATADFYLRLANSILTAFGIELLGKTAEKFLLEIGNSISRAMINASSGVSDKYIEPMAWVGIASDAVLRCLSNGNLLGLSVSETLAFQARFVVGSMNFYNKLKGVSNAVARFVYSLNAPETFEFCLCSYNGQATTCAEAEIIDVAGNNQKGQPGKALPEPLVVYVRTIDENGKSVAPSNNHRVKFVVTKGNGNISQGLMPIDENGKASVEWMLGNDGEQEVRAVITDVITEKEISEPVCFVAELETKEEQPEPPVDQPTGGEMTQQVHTYQLALLSCEDSKLIPPQRVFTFQLVEDADGNIVDLIDPSNPNVHESIGYDWNLKNKREDRGNRSDIEIESVSVSIGYSNSGPGNCMSIHSHSSNEKGISVTFAYDYWCYYAYDIDKPHDDHTLKKESKNMYFFLNIEGEIISPCGGWFYNLVTNTVYSKLFSASCKLERIN